MCKTISWSRLYEQRRAAAARFGKSVFRLPLARRATDVLLQSIAPGARVLEVGAGDRRLQQLLEQRTPEIRYQSLDIDPNGQHDYRDLAEISATFDCIVAFEVIEHLELSEIVDWLPALARRLAPQGRLVLSTPNTFYPPAYLRDATHRTPLCYDELAGLVTLSGLTVTRLVRTYNDPWPRQLARRWLFGWLFRLLGIDFARQIVLVAEQTTAAVPGD